MTTAANKKPGCLSALFPFLKRKTPMPAAEPFPYRLRDDFLSRAEASFFHVLKTMVGERLIICPKVSLAELFHVVGGEGRQAYQNRIDRKRIDFLLCDPKTLKPVLAIELDDASHNRSDRQERDAFVGQVFAAARLPLVRIPAQQAYDTRELGSRFQAAIQQNQPKAPVETVAATSQTLPPLCPKCGVPMVVRVSKRGMNPGQQFYGCPNYPRCEEIIPIHGMGRG